MNFLISIYAFLFDKVLYKHSAIKKYLRRNYAYVIKDFQKKKIFGTKTAANYPVWVCWWQGEKNMPEIIRRCYQSLLKNAGGHPVNLITENNYQKFVKIPKFILVKLQKGEISLTHFSDILRMYLLCKHGGLWIDATILTTAKLPDLKCPDIFTVRRKHKSQHVGRGRWTVYLFYTAKNNLLAAFIKTILTEYYKKETMLIDYFLMDYFVSLAYDNIPAIRQMLNTVPYNNENIYALKNNLDKPYDEKVFTKICRANYFHKLTWKTKFPKRSDKKLTFYGKLISGING